MAENTTALNIRIDANGLIAQDVTCIRCGYNLRSLLAEQSCPECGQPVRESLREDLLQFSDPVWLARLGSGMWWLIFACILHLASKLAWPILIPWLHSLGRSSILIAFRACDVSIILVRLVAVWKLTSPQSSLLDAQQSDTPRRLIRFLLMTAVAIGLLRIVLGTFPAVWLRLFSLGLLLHMTSIVPVIAGTVSVAGWILLYVYLVGLAHRLPSQGLIRLTWAACVVTTLSNVVAIFLEISTFWANEGANHQITGNIVTILTWLSPMSFVGSIISDFLLPVTAWIYRSRLRKILPLA